MHHTPWTKKASSLPSDRVQPKYTQSSAPSNAQKGKGENKDLPKSKDVWKLEKLLDSLRASSGTQRDPKGGCFCQAKGHALSPYTPICRECGLVLCTLNVPRYACPHCASPTCTPAVRTSIITRLEQQISETLAKEEEERQHQAEEFRKAAGAFPSLSTNNHTSTPQNLAGHTGLRLRQSEQAQTHKVISLNKKTKRVVVSSYTSTPVSSRPHSRADEVDSILEEDEPDRLPHPPAEVSYVKTKQRSDRSSGLIGVTVRYVPPQSVGHDGASKDSLKKKKKVEQLIGTTGS